MGCARHKLLLFANHFPEFRGQAFVNRIKEGNFVEMLQNFSRKNFSRNLSEDARRQVQVHFVNNLIVDLNFLEGFKLFSLHSVGIHYKVRQPLPVSFSTPIMLDLNVKVLATF